MASKIKQLHRRGDKKCGAPARTLRSSKVLPPSLKPSTTHEQTKITQYYPEKVRKDKKAPTPSSKPAKPKSQPDADAQPKRKRGRPPKEKVPPCRGLPNKKDVEVSTEAKKRRRDASADDQTADRLRKPATVAASLASATVATPAEGTGKKGARAVPRRKHYDSVLIDDVEFRAGDVVYVKLNDSLDLDVIDELESCEMCGTSAEDGAPMLECDGCLLGFHLACLEPPLERVPEGDWFCPTCTAQKQWGEGVGPGTAGGGRKSSTSCGSTLRARYLKGGEVDLVRIESIWSEETPDAKPTPPAKAKSKKGGAKGGATSSGAVAGNGAGSEGAAEKEVEYHFLGRWFIRPEETHCGRQPHHGSREVFLTDHLDENEMGTIIRKATVLRAQEYAAAAGGDDDLYLWEYIYRFSWRQFQRRGDDAEEWEDDDDGVIEDMMRRRTGRAADDGGDENYRIDDDEDDDDDIGDRNFHPLSEPAGGAHRGRPRGAYRRAVRARPSLAAIKHVDWDDDGDAGGNHAAATQHPLDRARAALCLSAVPRDLPCRNGAREAIEVFISNALLAAGETEEGKCMYISGVPGTGKTATVREALRRLRQKSHEGLIPPFQSVEVNGLSLQAPRYAYSVIHEALTSERVSPEAALDLLDKRFGGRGGSAASASIKRRGASGYARGGDGASMCVVVIDELDQLMSKNQAVLYNLFQWPGCRNSNLVVIGIANTMDLPERLLPRIASRLGADRLTFLPYTRSELEMILTERLKGVPGAFEPKSLELVSRKVAAVSGDARRALDIARRAAEVAQKRLAEGTGPAGANGMGSVGGAQRQQGSGPQAVGVPTQVTMSDVTTAIQEMCSSPHMQVMKSLSLHGKILLAAVALEEKRCGMSKVLFEQVAGLHAGLCRQNSINPPSTTALHLLVSKLGDCRLLVCEPATRLRLRGIRLNVSSADLPHVLREDGNLKWLEARFSSEPS